MSASDARARFADVVDAAEDLADLEAVRVAREEMDAGGSTVPWSELRAELGLV